jgi:hypothetical protein
MENLGQCFSERGAQRTRLAGVYTGSCGKVIDNYQLMEIKIYYFNNRKKRAFCLNFLT